LGCTFEGVHCLLLGALTDFKVLIGKGMKAERFVRVVCIFPSGRRTWNVKSFYILLVWYGYASFGSGGNIGVIQNHGSL